MKQQQLRSPARAGNLGWGTLPLLLLLFTGIAYSGNEQTKKEDMKKVNEDEVAIRALMDRFTNAFNAGDIDAIMKCYVPGKDLIVYDVVPRKEHVGADAYRAAWEDMFSRFKGTPKIAIDELGVAVDGNTGFSNSFMHVTGTDAQGHPVDRWVRVTDGYRKIDGHWLIVLEHISVPVDFSTGKLVPVSRP